MATPRPPAHDRSSTPSDDRTDHPRATTRAAVSLALLVGSAMGCTEASTAPKNLAAGPPQIASPLLAASERGTLHEVLGDASGRLMETVASLNHRASLQLQLTALEAAIDAGDAPAATRALARARAQLARQAKET